MITAAAAYEAANAAHLASFTAFQAKTEAYRARKIGDAEYLAARKAHAAVQDAFDVAFAAMQEA